MRSYHNKSSDRNNKNQQQDHPSASVPVQSPFAKIHILRTINMEEDRDAQETLDDCSLSTFLPSDMPIWVTDHSIFNYKVDITRHDLSSFIATILIKKEGDNHQHVVVIEHKGKFFELHDVEIPKTLEKNLRDNYIVTANPEATANQEHGVSTAIIEEFNNACAKSKEYQAACDDINRMQTIEKKFAAVTLTEKMKELFDITTVNALDQIESAFLNHQKDSRWYQRAKNQNTLTGSFCGFFTYYDHKTWGTEKDERNLQRAFDTFKITLSNYANNASNNTNVGEAYSALEKEIEKLPKYSKKRRIMAIALSVIASAAIGFLLFGVLSFPFFTFSAAPFLWVWAASYPAMLFIFLTDHLLALTNLHSFKIHKGMEALRKNSKIATASSIF